MTQEGCSCADSKSLSMARALDLSRQNITFVPSHSQLRVAYARIDQLWNGHRQHLKQAPNPACRQLVVSVIPRTWLETADASNTAAWMSCHSLEDLGGQVCTQLAIGI